MKCECRGERERNLVEAAADCTGVSHSQSNIVVLNEWHTQWSGLSNSDERCNTANTHARYRVSPNREIGSVCVTSAKPGLRLSTLNSGHSVDALPKLGCIYKKHLSVAPFDFTHHHGAPLLGKYPSLAIKPVSGYYSRFSSIRVVFLGRFEASDEATARMS